MGPSGPGDPAPPDPFDLSVAKTRLHMICMRLRCQPSEFPFKHFASIYANEKVYVTIIIGGEAVMFTDEGAEFPSDTLMASLRLLTP